MGGFVSSGEQAAGPGVERLAVDAGDEQPAARRWRGRGEVDVVAKVALVEVRRPAAGREPGQRQRRGADAGAELAVERWVPEQAQGLTAVGMVEVDVHQQRGGRGSSGVSAPVARTQAADRRSRTPHR